MVKNKFHSLILSLTQICIHVRTGTITSAYRGKQQKQSLHFFGKAWTYKFTFYTLKPSYGRTDFQQAEPISRRSHWNSISHHLEGKGTQLRMTVSSLLSWTDKPLKSCNVSWTTENRLYTILKTRALLCDTHETIVQFQRFVSSRKENFIAILCPMTLPISHPPFYNRQPYSYLWIYCF